MKRNKDNRRNKDSVIASPDMRAIVGCEKSGIVREALLKLGWDAGSCDILPAEDGSKYHWQTDIIRFLEEYDTQFDLGIFFPPCTHTAVSGARWFKYKQKEQKEAIRFFMRLAKCGIPHICIEQPISIMSTVYRKPDQIIQPWQFGHGEVKATCLWLKNLPTLKPTNIVDGRVARVHRMAPGPNRSVDRSRTLQGIADAMATQFTEAILNEG